MSQPSERVVNAYNTAARIVADTISQTTPAAMRALWGPDYDIEPWTRTVGSIRQIWANSQTQWNLGNWMLAGRMMHRALTLTIELVKSMEDAMPSALEIAWRNSPLRHVTQAVRGVELAQRQLTGAGVPNPDPASSIPLWVKAAAVLIAAAGVVYWVRK